MTYVIRTNVLAAALFGLAVGKYGTLDTAWLLAVVVVVGLICGTTREEA